MIGVTSSFADGPVNFDPTGPVEDQNQKLISSTDRHRYKSQNLEVGVISDGVQKGC